MEGGLYMNSPKVAVLTMEGTNNEEEAFQSWKGAGAHAEIIHIKKLESGLRKLEEFDAIFFPGGFSAGDYVRAGAIMASRLRASVMEDIENFVDSGKLIMGSCNGFQVLIELGLIPNIGKNYEREAALATNLSNRFEARTVYLKITNNLCPFLKKFKINQIIRLPIAHFEGRFIPKDEDLLKEILKNNMIGLKYVDPYGKEVDYPWNPNGSIMNIAGLCSKSGNILGLMPHPERVFTKYTHSDWTRGNEEDYGQLFFKGAVEYLNEKF